MPHFLFASILSTVLVLYTKKKKSLSSDGRWGAFVLGMVTFSSSMYVFGVVLLSFFLSSSKLTKFKADKKRLLEEDYETSSERNLTQVLCNGLMGGLIVGAFQMLEPLQCYQQVPWGTILLWAYIGQV
ncbi:hypothetical protein G6F56_013536 [Rhizopus delemar]|nr:hypothetical protein G6F56_013536 [Rhizopus delemar]